MVDDAEFPEIGLTSERAAELKAKRERSQEITQREADEAFKRGGSAPPNQQPLNPDELPPLTILDGMAFIEDYNQDMLDAKIEGFRPVPRPLAAACAATTVPLFNRLGIRIANAPTWALVVGAVSTSLMVFGPGVKCMIWGPPKEETPEQLLERAREAAKKQGRTVLTAPRPAPKPTEGAPTA